MDNHFINTCDDNIFNINFFGLRIEADTLIIIGLLIILYKEDVKDIYLYIVLILLLLS